MAQMKKISVLSIWTTIFIFTAFAAHGAVVVGSGEPCKATINSLSTKGKLSLAMQEYSLPEISFLDKIDEGVVGKRASVPPLSFDIGVSGEIQMLTGEFRKAMILGCEGVTGKIVRLDKQSITVQKDDGQVISISTSRQFDEILIQLLD